MMWAKEKPKRFITRPRMAMMSMYTVALCLLSLTAFASTTAGDYRITLSEAEQRIADELIRKGVGDDIDVDVVGRRSEDLIRRAEPVVMDVVDMDVDEDKQRFTASVLFSTEAGLNKPSRKLGQLMLGGRYEEMMEVPVTKFRLKAGTVIREQDVEWKKLPTSRLRRDTLMDTEMLIGKAPVRSLSPGRPVHASEVDSPPVVERQAIVQMDYQTNFIQIRAMGTAMQDGAVGDKIKVRNDDSGTEVDAVVTARGKVKVLPALAFN